jgi:hypothetical protein
MLFLLLASLLLYVGCKKNEETETYTLTVTLFEGVNGTPEAGSYTYNSGDQVQYSYQLNEGFSGLRVTIDDVTIDPSGIITISGDHTLKAYTTGGNGQFLVTVTMSTGVTGTPEAGSYYYDEGDQVDYNYSLEDGYTNLDVRLDGAPIGSTGSITVSQAHTLTAAAVREYNITGSWTLTESYSDESSFTVTVTFTGEIPNGIAVDSDGGAGAYTVNGNIVNFTLVFPDVTYEYTGSFSDDENMSGTAKRITAETNYSTGSWTASRTSGAATSTAGKRKGDI